MNDTHHEPSAQCQDIMYQTHHRLQISHVMQSHAASHKVESLAQIRANCRLTINAEPSIPTYDRHPFS